MEFACRQSARNSSCRVVVSQLMHLLPVLSSHLGSNSRGNGVCSPLSKFLVIYVPFQIAVMQSKSQNFWACHDICQKTVHRAVESLG